MSYCEHLATAVQQLLPCVLLATQKRETRVEMERTRQWSGLHKVNTPGRMTKVKHTSTNESYIQYQEVAE